MNNAVFNPMPAPAVMMKLGVADHIAQVGKVAPFRDRQVPARRLSFLAVLPFLLLGACAEAPAPRAALPAQRNVSAPAPTPCTIPNTGQADTPNVLNSSHPSITDRLTVECLRGVPPPRTNWSWSRPSEEGPLFTLRLEEERAKQEREAFQSRQRTGR